MDDDDIKIKKMIAAGTPDAFIEEIKAAHRLKLTRWGVKAAFLALMTLPLYLLVFNSTFGLDAINNDIALEVAPRVGGYLIHQNVGLMGIAAIFGWIFMAAALAALIVRFLPGQHRLAGLYALVEKETWWPIDSRSLRWASDTLQPTDTAIDFAGRTAVRYARSVGLVAAPFFFIGLAFLAYEVGNYALVSERGIYRNGSDRLYFWSDIDFVEVGCNETRDDSSLIYQVHFDDGWDINLANGDPIDLTLLEALERVDDSVLAHNKEFRLWEWLGRNPMHPACLKHYEQSWSTTDYQRLKTVLHVNELT